MSIRMPESFRRGNPTPEDIEKEFRAMRRDTILLAVAKVVIVLMWALAIWGF